MTGLHKNISALFSCSCTASLFDDCTASNLNPIASARTFAEVSLRGQFVLYQFDISCIVLFIALCQYLAASVYSSVLTTEVGSSIFAKSLINCCLSCAVALPVSSLFLIQSKVFILDCNVRYSFLLGSDFKSSCILNKSFSLL